MQKYVKDNRGLSLLEVIVAVGIFAIVAGTVTEILIYGWRANRIVWEQLAVQSEARKVVQDFVNELRTVNYSSIGSYPLEMTSSSQIIFYSDADKDTFRERIRYFLASTTLKKGIIIPTGTPLSYSSSSEVVFDEVRDVANGADPVFYYYDQSFAGASGTPMSPPVNLTTVRMVGIRLRLEKNPDVSPTAFNIESKVELRNLKSN